MESETKITLGRVKTDHDDTANSINDTPAWIDSIGLPAVFMKVRNTAIDASLGTILDTAGGNADLDIEAPLGRLVVRVEQGSFGELPDCTLVDTRIRTEVYQLDMKALENVYITEVDDLYVVGFEISGNSGSDSGIKCSGGFLKYVAVTPIAEELWPLA
jgi:hypothetical protein